MRDGARLQVQVEPLEVEAARVPVAARCDLVRIDGGPVHREGSGVVVRDPEKPAADRSRRVIGDCHTAESGPLVRPVHVDRAAAAAISRIAAGACGRVLGEGAVDDYQVTVEAADSAAVTGLVSLEGAADDDSIAAAEGVDRSARDVLAG